MHLGQVEVRFGVALVAAVALAGFLDQRLGPLLKFFLHRGILQVVVVERRKNPVGGRQAVRLALQQCAEVVVGAAEITLVKEIVTGPD